MALHTVAPMDVMCLFASNVGQIISMN